MEGSGGVEVKSECKGLNAVDYRYYFWTVGRLLTSGSKVYSERRYIVGIQIFLFLFLVRNV